jgi:O-antigen ligase
MKLFLKENFYDITVFLLLVTLSFSMALPSIFLGILILSFSLKWYKKQTAFPKDRAYFIFAVLIFYLAIKGVFNHTIVDDIGIYSRFLFVIILPVLFFPVAKEKIMIGFVISGLIAMCLSSFNIINYYLEFSSLPFSNGEEVNRLLIIERPYMGFFCLISTLICLNFFKNYSKHKLLFVGLSLFFSAFIFFIAARLSLVTLMGLLLIYLFFYSGLSVIKKIILIFSGIILFVTILLTYKNLSNRFFIKDNLETMKDYEPRIEIWNCASNIILLPDYTPIFGSKGYNWIEGHLVQCYSDKIANESKKEWFLKNRYNSHNQFIDFYLIGGIIGLFLFIYFIYMLLLNSKMRFYYFSLTLSLILFFLMENVLHRQLGCYMVGVLVSLTIKGLNEKN